MKNMKTFLARFIGACDILLTRPIMRVVQTIRPKGLAHYAMPLISIILIGILIVAPTISSVGSAYIRIDSSGGIIASIAYAKSGSPQDLQMAVDAVVAAGGGIVYVPEGSFIFEPRDSGLKSSLGTPCGVRFVVPSGGLEIIGAGKDTTTLQMPLDDSASACIMLQATGGYETSRTVGGWVCAGKLRISGITFKGRPNIETNAVSDDLVYIESCKDFRIDHCAFYYAGSSGIKVNDHYTQSGIYAPNKDYVNFSGGDPARISQGVIDHCDFIDLYKKPIGTNGYGIVVARAMHYWWTPWEEDTSKIFGVYDKNVFIEDCYFRGTRHAVAVSNGGVYVLRNSLIEDELISEAATTGHPNRENYHGMRGCEIYNCTIRYTGNYGTRFFGVHIEGGSALVYDNIIDNVWHGVRIGNCEVADPDFHPRGHPKDIYIWNNTITNVEEVIYVFTNGHCDAPTQGTTYFLTPPPSGWNYQPYSYPHPLTTGL